MCAEMHFLFNYTEYKTILDDMVEDGVQYYINYKGGFGDMSHLQDSALLKRRVVGLLYGHG